VCTGGKKVLNCKYVVKNLLGGNIYLKIEYKQEKNSARHCPYFMLWESRVRSRECFEVKGKADNGGVRVVVWRMV
jgi:hypothetical protein